MKYSRTDLVWAATLSLAALAVAVLISTYMPIVTIADFLMLVASWALWAVSVALAIWAWLNLVPNENNDSQNKIQAFLPKTANFIVFLLSKIFR